MLHSLSHDITVLFLMMLVFIQVDDTKQGLNDLKMAENTLKSLIDKLVGILPNQREVYTECVKVSKSSTFYQCFVEKKSATNALASENDKKSCKSPEPRDHFDIASLTIMAVKRIQILGRYNEHLFEHGLIFDFVKKTKQSKPKLVKRFHNTFKGPRCIKHEM
ncbi:unnamed protein product [Schistosoma rodhaini]|nr:unnamed protein product [Schistosoma rodhaini]